jgi:hypothetical protein
VWITSVPCKFPRVVVVAVTVAVKVEGRVAVAAMAVVSWIGLLDANELPAFSSSKRNTAEKMAHNMTDVSGCNRYSRLTGCGLTIGSFGVFLGGIFCHVQSSTQLGGVVPIASPRALTSLAVLEVGIGIGRKEGFGASGGNNWFT